MYLKCIWPFRRPQNWPIIAKVGNTEVEQSLLPFLTRSLNLLDKQVRRLLIFKIEVVRPHQNSSAYLTLPSASSALVSASTTLCSNSDNWKKKEKKRIWICYTEGSRQFYSVTYTSIWYAHHVKCQALSFYKVEVHYIAMWWIIFKIAPLLQICMYGQ